MNERWECGNSMSGRYQYVEGRLQNMQALGSVV